MGDHTEQVRFVTVDEAIKGLDEAGSTATIVNLTDQPILDLTLDGQLVLENISVNGSGIVSFPDVEFTIGGTLGEQSYSETSTPLANTDLLAAVWALPPESRRSSTTDPARSRLPTTCNPLATTRNSRRSPRSSPERTCSAR